jgi:hypothetical protein
MKAYFYLFLTTLVIVAGTTGCKCSKKITQQEQATTNLSEVTPVQPLEKRALKVSAEESVEVNISETNRIRGSFALPSVIIYKTKGDYFNKVPVGLNEERTAIVSYPGKTNIRGQEPIFLEYGFLLDKRGINPNVAFLKYTYDEYLQLEEIPPLSVLFNDIIDADPLTEMYHCGKISDFRNGEVVEQLNDTLKKCEGRPENIFKKLK